MSKKFFKGFLRDEEDVDLAWEDYVESCGRVGVKPDRKEFLRECVR